MPPLNLPQYEFKINYQADKKYIFDEWRKKWVLLTPEEWVRQHLLRFLTEERAFPRLLIAVEKPLKFNNLQKRCDIIAYSRLHHPLLLGECKAPTVALKEAVFAQIARYNFVLQVPYLLISNGLEHYFCQIDYETGDLLFSNNIPFYHELKT